MSDFLIENKMFYKLAYNFVIFVNLVIVILVILFLAGTIVKTPFIFIEMNFFVKLLFALFLVYRFNPFRKDKIEFTDLDKNICFSIGVYIIVLSFLTLLARHSPKFKQYLETNSVTKKSVDIIHII